MMHSGGYSHIARQHYRLPLLPLLRTNIIISRRPIIIIVVASITYYVLRITITPAACYLLVACYYAIAPHKNTCAIISIIIIIANTKRLKVGSNTKLRYFLFLLLVCYF